MLSHNPEGDIDISWAEEFFSRSLAAIQAARESNIDSEEVSSFLESRLRGIAEKVGDDRAKWQSIVKSGIPLNSDLIIEGRISELLTITSAYVEAERSVENRIKLLIDIEDLINDLPVLLEDGNFFNGENIDRIRELWLIGAANAEVFKLEGGTATVTKLYSFSLPWVLNGIAKKMRNLEREEEATLVEELSILVEAGLPTILKVKIYQAGIRSRVYAGEIGDLFQEQDETRSISNFRKELINNLAFYKDLVSDVAGEWLDLLSRNAERRHTKVKRVGPFTYGKVHQKTSVLLAKSIEGKQFLVSPDLKYIGKDGGNVDFTAINNIPGIEFRYSKKHEEWRMINHNPYVQVDR
jgi:hypothetical protein